MSPAPDPVGRPLSGTLATNTPTPTNPPAAPANDTSVLAGRYRLEEEVGRGGMGVVYRAFDPACQRTLAVKVLQERYRGNADLSGRFLEEARLTAQLQHPGVPPVHDIGTLPDGRPFFAMKLVKGRTLAELLKEGGPGDRLAVFEAVCQTVAYVHSRGVLHRDLKPSNVMVGAFGEVQVMDWGLAKVISPSGEPEATAPPEASTIYTARSSGSGSHTHTGDVLGTPAYMAPEQARGEHVDARADVFGLGAILCAVLTGKPPFDSPAEVAMRLAREADLSDAFARLDGCGADRELVALAKACLAASPTDRPADGAAVAGAVSAYQAEVRDRLRRAELARERLRRRVAVGSAAVLVAAILAGGGAYLRWLQVTRQAEADGVVGAALAEAEASWKQAQADPARFPDAVASARNADDLARGGRASESLREAAATLRREVEAARAAAEKDRRLLASLLDVWLAPETGTFWRAQRGTGLEPPVLTADERYATAFRAWGLDVDAVSAEKAAEVLGARPPAVMVEVVAALNSWAVERRWTGGDWQRLADLAEKLDPAPVSWQRELRAILRGDVRTEGALAAVAAALMPEGALAGLVPGESRKRLRKLADGIDVTQAPATALRQLTWALTVSGDPGRAEALLREAAGARPRDAMLHHTLGEVLRSLRPPRLGEVVEWLRSARSLRPELGVKLAHALESSGRREEAITLLRELGRADPDNPDLAVDLANSLAEQGKPKEAEAAARRALAIKSDYFRAFEVLGQALSGQGRFGEAEVAVREAIRLRPDWAGAHSNLSYVLFEQGKHPEAEAAARRAIELKPGVGSPHNNLGRALQRQGKDEEAEAAYREAIRLDPYFPILHNNLGAALHGQGKLNAAVASYGRAIALLPNYADAHFNLGLALAKQRKHAEAADAFREAVRVRPAYVQALEHLGSALNHQGKYAEAEAAYRRVLLFKTEDPGNYLGLAFALDQQGKYRAAEAACREAITIKSDADAHHSLGQALYGQDRFKEAAAAYHDAIKLKPNYAAAHYHLGLALSSQDRSSKEAEAAYREAIKHKPDYPQAHTNLGGVLNDQGRYREAEAACQEALKTRDEFPEAHIAHYQLGRALSSQRKYPEAEAAYKEAVRLKPQVPEFHNSLGHALRDQGKFGAALESLRKGHELGSKRPGWSYPSAEWVAGCERLIALDTKLSAILRGDEFSVDAVERVGLAGLCQQPYRGLPTAAARFYAAALAADPALVADPRSVHRYNAACCAAQVLAGQGKDAARVPDKERAGLGRMALAWLRADLDAYAKLAVDSKAHPAIAQRLTHWRKDDDLAAVRDKDALAKRSESERAQWEKLWADVADLLRKVQPR